MGQLVVVGVFEGLEEFLVALDVLAAVRFDSGVHGTLWALVGEGLGEAGQLGELYVLHRRGASLTRGRPVGVETRRYPVALPNITDPNVR